VEPADAGVGLLVPVAVAGVAGADDSVMFAGALRDYCMGSELVKNARLC
jgi:hypothetical protein